MSSAKFFSLALLLPAIVSAATTSCLTGACSFDVHNATQHGTAGGSMYISGNNNSVSSLGPESGWTLMGCSSDISHQNITAVCTGSNNTCSHVYNNGAVNTIVSLPSGCGKGGFARIAAEWTHDNQTVPADVAEKLKLRRRDGEPDTTVRGITLDTNFKAIPPSHHGPVSMFVQGASGLANGTALQAPASRRSLEGRSFLDDITKAYDDAKAAIEQSFDDTPSISIPIAKNVTYPLFQSIIGCHNGANGATTIGDFSVEVRAGVQAELQFGLVLAGTLVPPDITQFQLLGGLDAVIDGSLSIMMGASYTYEVEQTLLTIGIPVLSFGDALTIGPAFELNAKAEVEAYGEVSVEVDLSYNATGARFYFPDTSGSSTGTFSPSDNNLDVAVDATISAGGSMTAHLIPTVTFGIIAFGGDVSVGVDLELDAHAEISAEVSKSLTTDFNGSIEIDIGLDVNAVAQADLFSIFNKDYTVTLYTHEWTLWKKTFGSGAARRQLDHPRDFGRLGKRDGTLTCNPTALKALNSVVNKVIPAAQVGTETS